LAHLPHGCEVAFLECDWTDTVPPSVLEKFKPEIDRRRKRKEDKDAREERARVRAEREEDEKRYAHLRRRRSDEFTSRRFHADDFQPLVTAETGESEEEAQSSPPWRSKSAASAFAPLADISTSPSASRTVWGTPVIPAKPSSAVLDVIEDQQPIDDGWLQNWEMDLLEDDVVSQVQTLSVGSESRESPAGKKKKNKKITLMSTSVRRGA